MKYARQHKQIWYDDMNDAMHNIKRERELKRQWIKTLTTRYVTRFEPLALHPRLHHREGFPIHYLPPREPPPRRICYNTRSTKLLSQTTTSQPRGRPVAKQPTPLPKRVTTKLHLSLEGANHKPQPLPKREQTNNPINLTERDTTNKWGFTTSGMFQPQTTPLSSFPQNKILIE